MKAPSCLIASLAFSFGLPTQARADDTEVLKKLIPAATSMALADFDKLAKAEAPSADTIENKSLTLLLLEIGPPESEAAEAEFRYLTEIPRPSEIAAELTRNVRTVGILRFATGPVTFIHLDRITSCKCTFAGDEAKGEFTFHIPRLFEGKAQFAARRKGEKWQIVEFAMPARGIQIRLGDDGKWVEK